MLTSGQINAENLGWMQGMANWEPVSSSTFASQGIQLNPQPSVVATPKLSTSSAQKQMPAQQIKCTGNSNQNSSLGTPGTFQIGQAIGEAFSFYKSNILPSIAWVILAVFMGCIPIVNLIVPLMGVNFYSCVRNFRATGQKMAWGELFNFSHALDKIIGPIVVGILIAIGYFCLVIPGIILTCMWAFTPCIQGDNPEFSFFKAMKASKSMAKGNYMKIFLMIIISVVIAFLGILFLGVGALVTVPVAHVALYCAYDHCKPK